MAPATLSKRNSAIPAVALLLGLGAADARAQDQDLSRVNQDELASFYGRMNVVVGSGARAFGMGGAFLARADDATAASWNPAGLSYLRRTEVSVVGVHNDFLQTIPKVNEARFPIVENVDTRDQLRGTVADFIGAAYPLRIKERTGAIQLSYQRSFSFSGSRRAEGPVGVEGFTSDGTKVLPTEFTVDGEGGFDTLSLSSGFEVHPRLRVGASLNRWINGFSQTVDRPDVATNGYRRISSSWDISGTNVNLGLLFIPTPKLNLGAVLKTPFSADVRLAKTREDQTTKVDPATGQRPPADTNRFASEDVEIRFPAVYGFGASYRASNTLTISADFTRTEWSKSTIDGFFSLPRGSNSPTALNAVDRYETLPFPAVEEGSHGQADTNQWRAGAEWVLRFGRSGNVFLPLRAGFFRDGQPVKIRLNDAQTGEPLPEKQPVFWGYTVGLGVTVGGVLFDVAYIRELGDVDASRSNTGEADATRTIRYNRIFASMIVRFGPRR
jgi:long-subunit fatty acid transport protein